LWKKVKPNLSAGRVQSVAVRLLVEREREILNFKSTSSFKITGDFNFEKKGKTYQLKASLNKRLVTQDEVKVFLNKCRDANFNVSDVTTKPSKKSPAAPFTTSTLQQEASRKLGFSVSQTMTVAQKLYEAGHITYMRTDSVNLSTTAINSAKQIITDDFGEDYLKIRNYKTKSKGAQEAHEAIRPTFMQNKMIDGNRTEQRLYELIWKRTLASQMSDAKLEKTTIKIDLSNSPEKFTAQGEILLFDGFLKVYIESTDDENEEKESELLPPIEAGQLLEYKTIEALEKYTHHPPRYTEASLVKKLEELGIGRPSTYAPTISTIQNRGYVVKEDRPGEERELINVILGRDKIKETVKKEITGAEKAKLFPNDIGMVVNDFLTQHFEDIMSYNFTATVEGEFDNIAAGKGDWVEMLKSFYNSFHPKVEETLETSERKKGERYLGEDPKSGKPVLVRIGRYGPMAQIGESEDEEKPKFASLMKGQHLETITLEEALDLFRLPREVGTFEDEIVTANIGRYGPYVRHKNKFVSLKSGDDPYTIEIDRAIELIKEKREAEKKKVIKVFEEEGIRVLNGRYGPYITDGTKNYRIPKKKEAEKLSLEECREIMEASKNKKSRKKK
jgi:DNA topoisomerase-1